MGQLGLRWKDTNTGIMAELPSLSRAAGRTEDTMGELQRVGGGKDRRPIKLDRQGLKLGSQSSSPERGHSSQTDESGALGPTQAA